MGLKKIVEVEEASEVRGPKGSPLWKGLEKATYSLTPEQVRLIRAEALRRASAAGSGRPDASALVREAVDAWLAKNVKR
jgi:hypothetical protein